MDRLVCGDVGFGKTEVAIRAALKQLIIANKLRFWCQQPF
jgi:transcription-repair coupling factor (superfamily II helicase)